MERVLNGILPIKVFEYFETISSIPRESGNCKMISDYLVEFAKERGLSYYQDDSFNVVIKKDGRGINASSAPVILQGHMDMVCEKNYEYDSRHDFSKDGLKLAIMDDYVYAKGTTLGADDGIAVAYILSILDDDSSDYPPIEAVFTVDEEDGMKGALAFDASKLSGKILINLDHEVEGELLTCCAGGRRVVCHFDTKREAVKGTLMSITICGLCGGHSGVEIDKGRGNANLLLGRLLHIIHKNADFKIKYLGGGLTDTAIPREAKAEIIIDSKDVETVENLVYSFSDVLMREFEGVEENLMVYCENMGEEECQAIDSKATKQIGFLLNTVPDGIIKMSRKSESLVKTSLNCGIMKLDEDGFSLIVNMRSLAESEKEALSDKLQYLVETIGGEFIIEYDYPAWEYCETSAIRDVTFDTFQRLFGRNPKLKGFHAGLECGVFYKKIPGLDVISFGPEILGIHTTKEKLSISSTFRVYELLRNVLMLAGRQYESSY